MFNGLYTALITPFKKDFSLDEEGLIELIDEQLKAKVEGIVLLGTTSESPTLTLEESKRILEIATHHVQKCLKIIVGVGENGTQKTLDKLSWVQKYPIDAVMAVSPYYNKPTQEGLFYHFRALAEQSHLPIMLYNHPGRTGVHLHVNTLEKLLDYPLIMGLKETYLEKEHLKRLFSLKEQKRSDFSLLCGCDDFLFNWMQIGGNGSVCVTSNFCPQEMEYFISLCLEKKWDMAQKLFDQLKELIDFTSIESNPIPIKALLKVHHKPSGPLRLPMTSLHPQHANKLKEVLDTFNEEFACHS